MTFNDLQEHTSFYKNTKKMRLHNFRIQKNHQNRKKNRDNLTQIKESNFTSVMYSHVLLVTILSIKLLATNITLRIIFISFSDLVW